MTPHLENELVGIVGAEHVLVDADLKAGFEIDWTGRFGSAARCVVRPADTSEVAQVVAACAAAGAPIVPQGGNTGLVGGGVPHNGEVIVSMRRLADINAVDPMTGEIVAGAGATLADVQAAVAGSGFEVGVDLAARDSATIGGMIATNAGGVHVLRHGMMRDQLVGIETVLADGSRVGSLPALRKDNTGYDLTSLLAGSEGTLGIVCRAQLRLVPACPERTVAVLGLADAAALPDVVAVLRREIPSLHALEFFDADCLELVCTHRGLARPLPGSHEMYVLVECAARVDPLGDLADALRTLDGKVIDADATAVADTPADCRRLWEYREAITESLGSLGIPHKLDVTVAPASLAAFIDRVRRVVAEASPTWRVFMFGHAGDGNVHVNVVGPEPADDGVDDAVVSAVVESGGSISAEHGIGVAKRRWLHLARSEADLRALRAIRTSLDPTGIMNPACLAFEPPEQSH